MKLLLCITCNQVFSLGQEYQSCRGSHGGGRYINNLDAQIHGDPDKIFVLGFANSSLVNALKQQITYGDQAPVPMRGYGVVSPGREFTAFIIPDSASSIKRVEDKDHIQS